MTWANPVYKSILAVNCFCVTHLILAGMKIEFTWINSQLTCNNLLQLFLPSQLWLLLLLLLLSLLLWILPYRYSLSLAYLIASFSKFRVIVIITICSFCITRDKYRIIANKKWLWEVKQVKVSNPGHRDFCSQFQVFVHGIQAKQDHNIYEEEGLRFS